MLQEKMYSEFRRRNIYINAPDVYYYSGSNRDGKNSNTGAVFYSELSN